MKKLLVFSAFTVSILFFNSCNFLSNSNKLTITDMGEPIGDIQRTISQGDLINFRQDIKNKKCPRCHVFEDGLGLMYSFSHKDMEHILNYMPTNSGYTVHMLLYTDDIEFSFRDINADGFVNEGALVSSGGARTSFMITEKGEVVYGNLDDIIYFQDKYNKLFPVFRTFLKKGVTHL